MQRMGILFTLTCLLGFTLNMTDALEETLTMIVPHPIFELTWDCILCNCSSIFGGAACLPCNPSTIYETDHVCSCIHQYMCRSSVDWEYICRTTATICYVVGCYWNRYDDLVRCWLIDWFGYLGLVILIRGSGRIHKGFGEALSKTFAYYPGMLDFPSRWD